MSRLTAGVCAKVDQAAQKAAKRPALDLVGVEEALNEHRVELLGIHLKVKAEGIF